MNGFSLKRFVFFALAAALLLCAGCASADAYALCLSEAQSNNDTEWSLGFRDYIEVYNGGDSAVMLSDYFLSRSEEEPFACHLPARELGAGGYALLLCGEDLPDLSLPKEGCSVYLFHRDGTRCDEAALPAMENNVWQAEHGLTDLPSPGYENTPQGAAAYRASLKKTLIISEVVSSNSRLLPVEEAYNDLIELRNVSGESLNLSEFYLSDKKKSPFMWRLPDAVLEPGACFVVQASGEEGQKNAAPFKIPATGETIYINDINGVCIDALYVPPLTPDTSYGRSGDELRYYETPSIGKENPEGAKGMTLTPVSSLPSGPLAGETFVSLNGEGAIYYTLDGRLPTEKSARYDGAPVPVSPGSVLRVRALAENKLWSPARTYHYLADAEKYELPLLCISAEPGDILGPNGIYTLYKSRSREAAVNLTLIEDGQERFSVDCGLKIHGQGSRELKKKSFQVRFRGRYGAGRLEYPVFEDLPVTSFDALVLRCGSEDSNRAFFRDEFLTSLTAETMPEVLYQASRPVNLFIDGEYFGIYYIRERLTDAFAASHLGGEEEDVDMIKGWSIEEHGSRDAWMALMRYCRKHDLSNEENFAHVADQICLESFMDYYIARAYTGDRDYSNIRHVRSAGGDGLWRLVNFDIDWGFGNDPAALHQMIGKASDTTALNTVIINALLANDGFRDQMLTRLAWHLENTYAPERVLAHLESMADEVENDMHYNHERWSLSYESWEEHVQFLRGFVTSKDGGRVRVMIESAKRAFRLSDAEAAHYFGRLMP